MTILSLAAEGTNENVYYINNATEMRAFADAVNNGNTFEGATVKLNADINLECNQNNQWIPIGNCDAENANVENANKNPFKGLFEGNNHIISGIYIDADKNFAGLFGYNEGDIQNVTLKDSVIKSNKSYLAGIVGYQNRRKNRKLS